MYLLKKSYFIQTNDKHIFIHFVVFLIPLASFNKFTFVFKVHLQYYCKPPLIKLHKYCSEEVGLIPDMSSAGIKAQQCKITVTAFTLGPHRFYKRLVNV